MPGQSILRKLIWGGVFGVVFLCLGSLGVAYGAEDFSSVDVLGPSNPDVSGSGDFPSTTQNAGFFSPLGDPASSNPDSGVGSTTGSGTSSGTTGGSSVSGPVSGTSGTSSSGTSPGFVLDLSPSGAGSGIGASTSSFGDQSLTSGPTGGSDLQVLGAGPVVYNPEIPAGMIPLLMTALSGMVFWLRSFFSSK